MKILIILLAIINFISCNHYSSDIEPENVFILERIKEINNNKTEYLLLIEKTSYIYDLTTSRNNFTQLLDSVIYNKKKISTQYLTLIKSKEKDFIKKLYNFPVKDGFNIGLNNTLKQSEFSSFNSCLTKYIEIELLFNKVISYYFRKINDRRYGVIVSAKPNHKNISKQKIPVLLQVHFVKNIYNNHYFFIKIDNDTLISKNNIFDYDMPVNNASTGEYVKSFTIFNNKNKENIEIRYNVIN